MVLYVGKSGVRHWVDQEVGVALDRSTKDPDFRQIPVPGEGSNPEDLPLFLKQYQWLDLREGWSGASQLKGLIEGATRRQTEGVSLLPSGKSPFRGLQAFDVEDSLLRTSTGKGSSSAWDFNSGGGKRLVDTRRPQALPPTSAAPCV